MPASQKIFTVGVVSGAVMVVAMWLFHADQSPVHEYSQWYPSIGNALTTINLPAVFLGIAVSGNIHQPFVLATYVGVFLQWAVVGSVVAWVILRWLAPGKGVAGDA